MCLLLDVVNNSILWKGISVLHVYDITTTISCVVIVEKLLNTSTPHV